MSSGNSIKSAKKYQIILADPPWRYDFSKDGARKIEQHYFTMKTEDIKCLNIPSDENAVLYLWITAPKLIEGLAVMLSWGFRYRTNAIWDKKIIGMGYWFRIQHELLLVGVKGKFSPPIPEERKSSIISIKRASHSDKPDIIRDWIDKWYPDKLKLEVFARNHVPLFPKRDGWDVWGNEVESDIEL